MSLADLDRAHIVHPHAVLGRPAEPVIFTRGSGALLWDSDGKEYIDGTCGLWVCPVGHGRAELAEAARSQMETLEYYASFWDFSNEPSIELAARLAELAPPGLDRVFFTSGGSEGTETALKLARLAWHSQGQPDRSVVLTRNLAYHGVSYGSLGATGIPPLREGFGPLPGDFVHLTPPFPYRGTTTDALITELEAAIDEIGADRIAAFIGEPVIGVGGMVPPHDDYWPRVQEVLRRHGILLIFDEVVTGLGRTGAWFAAEHWGGIDADLIVTAKALTSGYFPLGAVLIGDRVLDLLDGAAVPAWVHLQRAPDWLRRGARKPQADRRGRSARSSARQLGDRLLTGSEVSRASPRWRRHAASASWPGSSSRSRTQASSRAGSGRPASSCVPQARRSSCLHLS